MRIKKLDLENAVQALLLAELFRQLLDCFEFLLDFGSRVAEDLLVQPSLPMLILDRTINVEAMVALNLAINSQEIYGENLVDREEGLRNIGLAQVGENLSYVLSRDDCLPNTRGF